jgi:hypothetical protein
VVKRRCSHRRCGPRLLVLSARNGRRKRSARGRPPWLRVALDPADDLSLALALRGASRDVLLRAQISAHPGQADHVQRAVGFPVATAVKSVPDDLAGGGFDGSDPTQTGEGSLAPQAIRVVSGHDQERGGALSVPMPAKETRAPGRPAPPSGRGERPALRSPRRGTRSGKPPNGARTTWLLPVRHGAISETEPCSHAHELL